MSSEVRFGNVSSIDYEAGKCEVTYPDRDDTVTEMVPFLSNGEYQTPEVDDLVLVLHPGESPEDAVVVGTVWNEKNKPPEGKEKVYRKDYANSRGKAYRKFDANAKELTDYVDGKKILKAKSLEIFKGTTGANWAEHEVLGGKARAEYLSPKLREYTFDILLDAALGVNPRKMLNRLTEMSENGEIHYLIIGFAPVSQNKFRVTEISDSWDSVIKHGLLMQCKVSLTIKEYI